MLAIIYGTEFDVALKRATLNIETQLGLDWIMKKLPDEDRLRRGAAVLLNAQDKADLKLMAEEKDVSQSALLRLVIQQELESWRASVKRRRKKR